MNERAKITASHLSRQAIVYLRQSSGAQVEHNRVSTVMGLPPKPVNLAGPMIASSSSMRISTGSGFVAKSGFVRLTAEVALAHVGLVLGPPIGTASPTSAV